MEPEIAKRTGSQSLGTRSRALLLGCLLLFSLIGGLAARHLREDAAGRGMATTSISASSAHGVHLSGRLDRESVLRGGDGRVKLELVLGADEASGFEAPRVATDLIVVFDRSGSMQGEPLERAVSAVRELTSSLTPDDRFALVSYSVNAETFVPLGHATPEAVEQWQASLARLRASGGTNLSAGLDLAARLADDARNAGRNVRVMVLSDGHANQGDHSLEGLRARAARAVTSEYVLSAVGIGDGFDEHLMSTLADAGTGNFYYVRSGQDLSGVFEGEFAAARETVASALEVVIEHAADVSVLDAAGYPLERRDGKASFRPGSLFAGQERRVWITFAAPTGAAADAISLARVRLGFTRDAERLGVALERPFEIACVEDESSYYASIDEEVWSQGVVVDEYNALRQRVARHVQSGDRVAAASEIREYRAEQEALNQKVESDRVTHQLRALGYMLEDVDSAFAASPAEVNRLGKKLSADSIDGRRVGAKK